MCCRPAWLASSRAWPKTGAGLMAAPPESDGGETKITFQRVIVYPDGHKHIEGVTPNQLPAPASHVLPGSDRRVSNSDDSDDKSET